MRETAQGPGAAAQTAGTAAENARLDAQLELAAKKAALRSLEAQSAAQGVEGEAAAPPAPPAPPGGRRNTVIIEQDGKTTVLENPTTEQLSQVGIGTSSTLPPDPAVIQTVTISTLGAIVLTVWMVLRHRRGGRNEAPSRDATELQSRIARIENAVESIAVEVERISEGQRFTSRILSEGAAQPVTHAAAGDRAVPQTSQR
jgi:hypothetical protein